MPFIHVLQALNAVNAVSAFLESGGVLEVLADAEFAAARKAFSEVSSARDKRGQIWVCIGHLNSCLEANRRIFADSTSNWKALQQITMTQRSRLDLALSKVRFILCLLAVCYAHLGEIELCRQHLDAVRHANSVHGSPVGNFLTTLYGLSQFVVPTILVEAVAAQVGGLAEEEERFKVTDADVVALQDHLLPP